MTMPLNVLRALVAGTDLTVRSYSGRVMYGKRCAGIVGPSTIDVLADLVEAADSADVDLGSLADLMRSARQDSMGRDVIVYWPRINWPEDEE